MVCASRLCCKGATAAEFGVNQQFVKAPSASSVLFGSNLDTNPGYSRKENHGCKGMNDLGIETVENESVCAAKCNAEPTCVSFEYKKKAKQCQLSSECTNPSPSAGWVTSIKKEGEHEAGFVFHPDMACDGMNDLGVFKKTGKSACADKCSKEPTCVSFETNGSKCQLSSECTPEHAAPNKKGWDLFTKQAGTVIPGYQVHETGGCKKQNDLGEDTTSSLQECAALCQNDANCVSFEYPKLGKRCQRSSTCDKPDAADPTNEWRLYTKAPYHFEVTAVTGTHEHAGTYAVGIQFLTAGTWSDTLPFITEKTVPEQVIKKTYATFVRPTKLKFIHGTTNMDGWVVGAVHMTDANGATTDVMPAGSKEIWVKHGEAPFDIAP